MIKRLLLAAVFSIHLVFAFNYGEHKEIGDQAFIRMVDRLIEEGVFPNRETAIKSLAKLLNIEHVEEHGIFTFNELT